MQTLELVTFRLAPGTDRAAFLAAAEATADLIRCQPGFQARMLTEGPDGRWSDIVTWASPDAATTAAKVVMADPAFAPFCALIDMASASMSHSTLVWRMD